MLGCTEADTAQSSPRTLGLQWERAWLCRALRNEFFPVFPDFIKVNHLEMVASAAE